jgi:hypothetical protein
MAKIESVFHWCLKQGEKGDKHKGLRKINSDLAESKAHLKKAESNLETMQYLTMAGKQIGLLLLHSTLCIMRFLPFFIN